MQRNCGWVSQKMGGLISQQDIDALTCLAPTLNPPTTQSIQECYTDDDCVEYLDQCENNAPGGYTCQCVNGGCLETGSDFGDEELPDGGSIQNDTETLVGEVNVTSDKEWELEVEIMLEGRTEEQTRFVDYSDAQGARILSGELY